MTDLVVTGGAAITGAVTPPGDKSISHRALMLAAIAPGRTTLRGLGPGEDVAATISCVRAYGVGIDRANGALVVEGRMWKPPSGPLDCRNSGTTMRLLAGLAAHHDFASVLDGDVSLRRRPMDRVVRPLTELGATVEAAEGRYPPLRVEGGHLAGTTIDTGVASAQVKSCALFAGLAAEGRTTVVEPRLSRDHTERILAALGAPIASEELTGGEHRVEIARFAPDPFELEVPGDVSSAAFVVAAAILAGPVTIDRVGLNPTRTLFLDTLVRLGADVRWEVTDERLGEPAGRIEANRSSLSNGEIDGADPRIQDELALLAVLATQADGETTVRGADELRVKESDRISAIVNGLRALRAEVHELVDGFVVRGPTRLRGARVDPQGDHRIAMALAVAGLIAEGTTTVQGFECAAVSWPGFEDMLRSLGAEVETR
jgi:3-phosphoshikimate 1-carboxyvinyltransferase